jgi:hypothetical protein
VKIGWLVLVFGVTVGAAQAKPPDAAAPTSTDSEATKPADAAAKKPADVVIDASLDRTAVWVADPITYTVKIVCAPGIDVLDDDLSRDKLNLDGLEVTGTEASRDPGPGGTTIRRFRYHLTSYHVDQRALKIAPLSFRYYHTRPGQGIDTGTPAGDAEVPGAVVAFRSMLPEDQETYPLRDGRTSATRPRLLAAVQPVGVGLVVASIVPVLFWMAMLVRERTPRKERRSSRQMHAEERTTLETVRALDVSAPDARRDAYTKINSLVRDHLRDVCGIAGPSLTPAEIEPALSALPARARRVPIETVTALLTECDAARYAPPDALPSADACRAAVDQAAQVLAAQ